MNDKNARKLTVSDKPTCCGGCKFWFAGTVDLDGQPALGQCKRFPPNAGVIRATTLGPVHAFPITPRDESCGEFLPRS